MSRKSTLEPRWLVSMLTAWARHCVAQMDKGLGYPNRSILLSEWSARSRGESTSSVSLGSYDQADFEQVESVMRNFVLEKPLLFAAVSMYYKPYTVHGLRELGYPLGDSTYYYRLRAGHKWLEENLYQVERKNCREDTEICEC